MSRNRVNAAIFTTALSGVLLATLGRADDITLKNGQKYSGIISRQGDSMLIRTDDGKSVVIQPSDIATVDLNDLVSPAQAAAAEWTRVAQEIKAANDLQLIITLHQDFLKKYPDVPLARDVQSSLAVYEALSKNDGVKFRGRWIPRAQVEVMVKQWRDAAQPALDLYQAGQWKAALDAVKTALAADPQNPDALTLAGLCAFHAGNQVPLAKTYFTTLAAADPTSVLAENNLAVIAGIQKSPVEGFTHYTRALQINAGNRLLIDNIQEAINSYLSGGGDKNNSALKTLQRQLDPAEAGMEREMARKENGGLKRWGASWIAPEQIDRLTAFQTAAKAAIAQLDSQYQSAKSQLAGIETQINQTNADLQIQTNNALQLDQQLGVNLPGLVTNIAAVAAARDAAVQNVNRLQAYLAQLQNQHGQLLAATRNFFAQADRVRSALTGEISQTSGGYTGTQRIMEWGEDQKPPAPAAIADPPALPAIPQLPTIATPAAPLPVAVPTQVQSPVFIQQQPVRSGR